jgi:hypothetical protein
MKRKPTSSTSTPGVDKVDPELKRQLESASTGQPVRVSFTLTTPAGKGWRDASDTHATVNRLVEGASRASRSAPERLNVLGNTQSFTITAQPDLLRELVQSDQIAKAIPARSSEEMVIRPVGPPKIVELPDLTQPVRAAAKKAARSTTKTTKKAAKAVASKPARKPANKPARPTASRARKAPAKTASRSKKSR